MNWDHRFARRTELMQRSTVRDLLRLTAQPGMISFAGGLPAPELFPLAEVAEATTKVLQHDGSRALQYGETEGIGGLRDWVAAHFSRPHFQVQRENVMIVSGSQQALDLIGRVFLETGDRTLVENPTYLATLLAWRPTGAVFEAVPSDADGMVVEQLTAEAARAAKLLYVVPNFQNPQGTTLALARRQALVKTSRECGLPIIEDNPYGELRYQGSPLPHLLELDARRGAAGEMETNIIHLGTFSKVLAPGLRVGWVIAPADVIDKLVQAKQAADLHTSTLCQHVVLELVQRGVLEKQLPKLRAEYGRRMECMLAALAKYFPTGLTWTQPAGGMFLLARLPEGMDATELLKRAIAQKVAFVPGAPFHLDGAGANTMRLNFSHSKPEVIEEGMQRLRKAWAA